MSPPSAGEIAPDRCPLCGGANDCQLCTSAAHKGPCWCQKAIIPEELLARVPPEAKHQACICRACVESFHRERMSARRPTVGSEDFYLDRRGNMVFTAAYLLRRGYCCGSDCRHCPYPQPS